MNVEETVMTEEEPIEAVGEFTYLSSMIGPDSIPQK